MLVLSYLPDLRPRGIKAEAVLSSSQCAGEAAMIMTATTGVQGKVSEVQECAGCNKKIHDKYVLKVGTSIPEPPVSLPAGHGPLLARGLPQVRLL